MIQETFFKNEVLARRGPLPMFDIDSMKTSIFILVDLQNAGGFAKICLT